MPSLKRALGFAGLLAAITAMDGSASPSRLVPTLGTTAGVSAVAFSSDGRRVVTGGREGEVILWDVATGGEIRRLEGHTGAVVFARFLQHDGKILTGSGDGTARLWDAARGRELQRFEAHMDLGTPARPTPQGRPFALSPDEEWIVTWHARGALRVWASATGTLSRELPLHEKPHCLVVSRDDRYLLVSGDFGTRLLSFDSGVQAWTVPEDRGPAAFAPGKDQEVATSRSGTIFLREITSGRQLKALDSQDAGLAALAWSTDGTRLLSGDLLGKVRLRQAETWRELRSLQYDPVEVDVAFDPTSLRFVVGDNRGHLTVYEEDGQRILRRLQSSIAQILWLGFTGGRPQVVAADRRGTGYVWDPAGQTGAVRFTGHVGEIFAAELSPDGKEVLTGGRDSTASLWDARSGVELRRFEWHQQSLVSAVALGDQGRVAMTAGGPLSFWNTQGGDRHDLPLDGALMPLDTRLSPDGRRVAVRKILPDRVEVFDTKTGASWVRSLDATALRFSPDGGALLVAQALPAGKAVLLRSEDGAPVGEISLPQYREARWVDFSADGQWIITAHDDPTAHVWRRGGGLYRDLPHTHAVDRAALSPDGRWALTSARGILHLWDLAGDGRTAKLLCRLVLFTDGNWLAVDPEGRFDASDMDDARGVFWQTEDDPDPFRLLPPQVFMREYYEPQLLSRILQEETFKEVRPLATLDRAQPEVEIARIASSPGAPGKVDVTVAVRAKGSTGISEVRLLRDGRLVGIFPQAGGHLDLDAEGRAEIPFPKVALPSAGVEKEVVLGAYAFNGANVKSLTERKVYPLPASLPSHPGRAYLLLVGVNESAVSAWNLRYAANDAHLLGTVLADTLQRTKAFQKVIRVPLIAESSHQKKVFPDRAMIRAVIDRLAGHPVPSELASRIPAEKDLLPATPDDLVVLAFATHGVADPAGKFYLAPHDVGRQRLQNWISSDDLSDWLRDVDAGSIVMIVDACQSAATISAPGFKPGPLGNRGLGQLAYDKGMQVLAASGVDSVALESSALQQGFLTYALARSGLAAFRADWHPKDGAISVSEWLAFGVRRVPEIHEEVRKGEKPADEPDRTVEIFADESPTGPWVQQPVFFNFIRGGRDLLVLASPLRARAGLAPPARWADAGEAAEATELRSILASENDEERATRLYRFLDALPDSEAAARAHVDLARTLLRLRADSRELLAAVQAAVSHLRGQEEEDLATRINLLRDGAAALLARGERLDDAWKLAREAWSLAKAASRPADQKALENLSNRIRQRRAAGAPARETVP